MLGLPAEWSYLRDLTSALTDEVRAANACPHVKAFTDDANRLTAAEPGRHNWYPALAAYTKLKRAFGSWLAGRAEVADSYLTMEEFWDAAAAQRAGTSGGTFWDTYEHGDRRRLEQVFAEAFRSDSSVLVNSGMSAVHVALSAVLRPGDTVIVDRRSYFETGELLDTVLAPAGITVVRVDLSQPDQLDTALQRYQCAAVLVETALNAPVCTVPVFGGSPSPVVVVDNSILSHAVDFRQLARATCAERLLVVESAIKYATHDCSAGVVYGSGETIEAVRAYARRTGQQLQSKAFHFLRAAEIRSLAARMALHAERNRRFVECLDGTRLEIANTDFAAAGRLDAFAGLARQAGPGSLVFLRTAVEPERDYTSIVNQWAARCRDRRLRLDIRAGFGWDVTSARSYRSGFLNQPDAPTFIRVSLGIGPMEEVEETAQELLGVVSTLAARNRSAR